MGNMFSTIHENMPWPPPVTLAESLIPEYAAWYSGDADRLIDYYNVTPTRNSGLFWDNKKAKSDVKIHVPLAAEIAEASANLLFGESPYIKTSNKETNKIIDTNLRKSDFYSKIIEGAEICAALGGVYYKYCWDKDLSKFPLPVVVQPDRAIPVFKFGILKEVLFWKRINVSEREVFYLLECYYRGGIETRLYKGTDTSLGKRVDLKMLSETQGMKEVINFNHKMLFAAYIPNARPNRIDRGSHIGRSDYSNNIGLLHAIDEAYSAWVRDIRLAKARLLIPETMLNKERNFDVDELLYVKLDVDPLQNNTITPQQFDIRATEFEMSIKNFVERAISNAGYSPQSFGLNIEGRAESGTALYIRERKTYNTKSKKENYWLSQIEHLVVCSLLIGNDFLGEKINLSEVDEIKIEFNDASANDILRVAQTVKTISDANAISTEIKVRMLHPEWDEDEVISEVKRIQEANRVIMPEFNLDMQQYKKEEEAEEE